MSSYKRSRATYESDLQASEAPYVSFGTPLPPADDHQRDDGSYVPMHLQEVRDEKGRRRLHGAFTGGWSAGYFNTVGSKEGWAPSTFVSSRSSRHKDNPKPGQQRPEDFMDEEDLADAAEAEKIQTATSFSGLGDRTVDAAQTSLREGLVRPTGDTMGYALLRKMGWKDGQGIGPRVRRAARLGDGAISRQPVPMDTHLFAPDDIAMISLDKQIGRGGLGYQGETGLERSRPTTETHDSGPGDNEDEEEPPGDEAGPMSFLSTATKKPRKKQRGGIGIGILNDNGSDDDDPYSMGPRISYNRMLGGAKKKKTANKSMSANPALGAKPTFLTKRAAARSGVSRRCGDSRPALPGFVLALAEAGSASLESEKAFPPPVIPPGWKPARKSAADSAPPAMPSTAEAARASKHDPRSRAAALGESQLPGKSVFDFLSSTARDRIAAASGRANLPPGKGETPAWESMTSEQRLQSKLEQLPVLDKGTAVLALSRGSGGRGPYGNDETKQSRFRVYLEKAAGFGHSLPSIPDEMAEDDFVREMEEFYSCAQLFKPMAGFMATRFTTSSTSTINSKGPAAAATADETAKHLQAQSKDPAEEAAKLGMFGHMTRSVQDFYPTRLLCKRFNVRPPDHVQADPSTDVAAPSTGPLALLSGLWKDEDSGIGGQPSAMTSSAPSAPPDRKQEQAAPGGPGETRGLPAATTTPKIQSEPATAATAQQRPSDEVFKAIFGDSSDEE